MSKFVFGRAGRRVGRLVDSGMHLSRTSKADQGAGKTGLESKMKVSYGEGFATADQFQSGRLEFANVRTTPFR